MAKSSKTRAKVSEIRDPAPPIDVQYETATAVMDPPEPEAAETPATPFDPPAPEDRPKIKPSKSLTFFERVQSIPRSDWADRAKVKVYRLAPIINRLVSTDNKYITIYREPITEEKIKIDHGSGKYRLYLNYKPAGRTEQELDSTEIDILDPKYPPNVPPGEWIDDDKNKQWAWARQPGMPAAPPPPPPPAPTGLSELVNVLRVGSEMRKEVRDEMQPTAQAAPAAPATPAPPDPFDTVAKIMGLRTNDPMIALLMQRMDAQDKAAEAARLREYELQKELRQQSQTVQTAAAPKSLLDQVKELAGIRNELKGLFGGGGDDGATLPPIRSGKFAAWDFARELIPQVFNSRILNALADKISAGPALQMNPGQMPVNGNGADDTMTFVQHVVTPAMLLFFKDEEDGGTFAEWLYGGHPGRVPELQAYGEQRIFELYKQASPRADWAILSARGEPAFAQFVHEFCVWRPEPDEEENHGSTTAQSGKIIDLDTDDREESGS